MMLAYGTILHTQFFFSMEEMRTIQFNRGAHILEPQLSLNFSKCPPTNSVTSMSQNNPQGDDPARTLRFKMENGISPIKCWGFF